MGYNVSCLFENCFWSKLQCSGALPRKGNPVILCKRLAVKSSPAAGFANGIEHSLFNMVDLKLKPSFKTFQRNFRREAKTITGCVLFFHVLFTKVYERNVEDAGPPRCGMEKFGFASCNAKYSCFNHSKIDFMHVLRTCAILLCEYMSLQPEAMRLHRSTQYYYFYFPHFC